MNNRRIFINWIAGGLGLCLVVGILGWGNYRFVMQNPGGNDFLPRWAGTRMYIMQGTSPYSDEATLEIQRMIFGRAAQGDEDQSLFVYPFYSIFVFAPFALIQDYMIARAAWMTVLEINLLILGGISLALSRWRLPRLGLVILLVFMLLWYHSFRPVINGNASIVVAVLIAAAFLAMRSEQDIAAGFLLAMATIKPQMVILLIPFVCLWAISRQRWALVWSIFGTLALLVASMSLLIPDWLLQNVRQIFAYPGYTLPGSPGEIFLEWMPGVGRQLGLVLTVFFVGIALWEWRSAWQKDFRWFLWTAYLTLAITNLIGIRTTTENYIALLPGVILIFAAWDRYWGVIGRGLVVTSLILLFLGLWWLFLTTLSLQQGGQATQHSILFFPLPLFSILGLYWVRWWMVRAPQPLMDQLRQWQNGKYIP